MCFTLPMSSYLVDGQVVNVAEMEIAFCHSTAGPNQSIVNFGVENYGCNTANGCVYFSKRSVLAEEWTAAAAASCLCNLAACASFGDTSSTNKPQVTIYEYTWLIEA